MRRTIGDEVLNTNTMTVTTKDDPTKELIPSILLKNVYISGGVFNRRQAVTDLKDLVITFKNENKVIKSYYKPSEVYFKNKDLTP